jgi:hypothetical protein
MGLTVEDRLDIMELLARYNHAIDGLLPDPAEAWADTFTDDGVFETVGHYDPPTVLRGRKELVAFAANVQETRPRQGYHWNNNVIIEGDGDEARETCYLRTARALIGGPEEVGVTGVYRDELRKVAGRWRFTRRVITFDD